MKLKVKQEKTEWKEAQGMVNALGVGHGYPSFSHLLSEGIHICEYCFISPLARLGGHEQMGSQE